MNALVAAVLVALCGSALARPQVPTFNPFPEYKPINLNIPRPSATPTRPPVRAPPPPAPVRRPVVPAPLPQPAPIPVATPNRIVSSQPSNDGHWIIIKQAKDQDIDGKYSWNYETENGIAAEETGGLKQVGPQEDGTASQGFYSYTAPDGTPIRVTYTADENGFVPDGAHLPVAPPIPEVIQRALAYNAAHPEEDLSEGGTKRV